MAKSKNKKRNASNRGSRQSDDMDTEFGSGADIREEGEYSNDDVGVETGGGRGQSNKRRASGRSEEFEFDPKQLWETFRGYIEEHPGRASAVGAVVGGVAAGLLASETGRSFLRATYGYARPMIADYARQFVSNQGEDVIQRSLPQ